MNNTPLNPHLRQTNVIGSDFCPKDLMIGNFINRKYYNPHPTKPSWELAKCKVIAVRENNSLTVKDKDKSHMVIDYWEGIEISEFWLKEIGFEETYNSQFILKFDHKTHNEIGFDFSRVEDKSMEGFRFYGHYIKIQYVHQVQNLFYCLTGQELVLSCPLTCL